MYIMPGALLQLVAIGAQNTQLNTKPEITFFKISFKRHTMFAMESIEQTFNGQVDFGRRVTSTMSRSGDLAWNVFFQATLPEINQNLLGNQPGTGVYARWLDYIGEQLISSVEIEIGGQKIDKHYGDWMHIWNQLTMTEEQKKGYYKMIGHTTQLTYLTDPSFAPINGPCSSAGGPAQTCAPRDALPETTLYIPLMFWFNKNPGLALPLIALQFHEVKINIDIRPLGECLWAVKDLSQSEGNQQCTGAYAQSLVAGSLFIDYIFLEADERRKMAQNPHEYLIEQLQFTGDETVGSASSRNRVNLSHPVKEIVFVVQPDVNVDYCSSFTAGTPLFAALGAQPFNYTDAIDAVPNAMQAFSGPGEVNGANAFIATNGLFQMPGAIDGTSALGSNWYTGTNVNGQNQKPFAPRVNVDDHTTGSVAGSFVSDAGAFVLAQTAFDLHCWGENPVITAKLQLNGQDRFSEREGSYFDVVQPYQFHTRHPDTGINVYSFSIKPEEFQPSGNCNFSRIDNAFLNLVLSSNAVAASATAKLRIYGVGQNMLRFVSGMAGLAYSS